MKTKYLFYSLALAGAFTACSQDELFDAPALEGNGVADRPVAGVVTFVNDDVESRYDRQNTGFETGDEMGLYLMDEFTGHGEAINANETLWNWQSCWWSMYKMVDYINTNYGYAYDGETGEWINRASQLVEGNYIAMFPQNKVATNRQDLWHAINANVLLEDHTDYPRYYVNRENQFFLGYEQIKRDQKAGEATGELRADISMKSILTYAKFKLINEGKFNFKPKKIVFKAPYGQLLPNVAYVRPADIVATQGKYTAPWWAFANEQAIKKELPGDCGSVLAWSEYDRTTFTQAAARDMVEYISTADRVPYGMTEAQATPVFEYVFNFPADADMLYGSIEATAVDQTSCTVSIALPMFEGWQNMEVVVYGEMQTDEDTYRPGILKARDDSDNGIFTLNNLRPWNSGQDIPVSKVTFDHNYFYQQEEFTVSTTEDLITMLKARLSDVDTSEPMVIFDVTPYGDGLEITDEVVNLIKKYESDNNVDVVVMFNNYDSTKTPIIFKTDAFDEFLYGSVNVVIEAPQTIKFGTTRYNAGSNIVELRNFSTINAENCELYALDIINEVGATLNTTGVTLKANVHNEGVFVLTNSSVTGNVRNDAQMTAAGSVVYGYLTNDNNCLNCGADKAVLTVNGLSVANLFNADEVVVNGALALLEEGTFENNGLTTINETGSITGYYIKNEGTMNNSGSIAVDLFENNNVVNHYGYIKTIHNAKDLNVYGKAEIAGLYNMGTLYVWSADVHVVMTKGSQGITIFEGVDAQHVGNWENGTDLCPDELRVYRAYEEKTATSLKETYSKTLFEEVWTKYDIFFDKAWGSCGSFNKILVESGDVTFTVAPDANNVNGYYELYKVTFALANGAILNIEDNSDFAIDKYEGKGEIHVGSGSTLGWGGGADRKNQGTTLHKGYEQIILK